MNKLDLGVYVPVFTPCDGEDRLLPEVFEKHCSQCLDAPVQGLYISGGTGEGLHLRVEERKQITRIAVDACHRHEKTAIVHVGAAITRDAAELAGYAAAVGADGISSVPPAGFSFMEQKDYYQALSEVSGLPMLLYYFPDNCGEYSLGQMLRLLNLPGVAGLKLSSWDLFYMEQLLKEKPDILCFNGKDEYLAVGMGLGASGGIGMWYNLFPRHFAGIYEAARTGDLEQAFRLQRQVNQVIAVCYEYGICPAFEMLLRYQGLKCFAYRRPSRKYTYGEYTEFIDKIKPLMKQLL